MPVPALPDYFTWGTIVEEVLAAAREAIAVYLEGEEDEYGIAGDILVATVAVPDVEPARVAS